MKNTNDLKELWKQNEPTAIPPIQEVTTTAKSTIGKIGKKLFLTGFLLAATLGFLMDKLMTMQNEAITTKIGLTLICLGIVFYLIVSNPILTMFMRNEFSVDSRTFLDKLVALKHRLEILYKTVTTVYFIALTAGISLTLIEDTMSETLLHKVLVYGLSLGWMLFAWLVLRPREMKKLTKLTDSINALQNIRNQFAENQ